MLRLKDLGKGFQGLPYMTNPRAGQDEQALSTCLGGPPPRQHETARAFSSQFVRDDGRRVQASVTFADTAERAAADLRDLRGAKAISCLKDLMIKQLRRLSYELHGIDVVPISPITDLPDVVAYRFTVVIDVNDQDITQIIDLISAIRGRAEVQATFQDVNEPVESSLESRAMLAMLNRL